MEDAIATAGASTPGPALDPFTITSLANWLVAHDRAEQDLPALTTEGG